MNLLRIIVLELQARSVAIKTDGRIGNPRNADLKEIEVIVAFSKLKQPILLMLRLSNHGAESEQGFVKFAVDSYNLFIVNFYRHAILLYSFG
jgi:hypothetical protein